MNPRAATSRSSGGIRWRRRRSRGAPRRAPTLPPLRRPQSSSASAYVEVGHRSIRHVVEVLLDVHQPRQRDEVVAVVQREGGGAAARRAARHRARSRRRGTTRGAARTRRRSRRSSSACRAGRSRLESGPSASRVEKDAGDRGWSTPNRRISPTSCSLTPRSIAAASETLTPAAAQRSRARSFSSVRGLPRIATWVASSKPSNWR